MVSAGRRRREEEAETTLITREHFPKFDSLLCPLSTGICHDMRDLFLSAARWLLTDRQRLRSGGPLPCTVQPSPEGGKVEVRTRQDGPRPSDEAPQSLGLQQGAAGVNDQQDSLSES